MRDREEEQNSLISVIVTVAMVEMTRPGAAPEMAE